MTASHTQQHRLNLEVHNVRLVLGGFRQQLRVAHGDSVQKAQVGGAPHLQDLPNALHKHCAGIATAQHEYMKGRAPDLQQDLGMLQQVLVLGSHMQTP